MFSNYPFSVCLHYYPFSITNGKKRRRRKNKKSRSFLAELARYKDWQAERVRRGEEGIIPATQWQPIWQNNHCLATAVWYFTRGRELYMKCQGKHWPWQADHRGNPLLCSDNGPLMEPPGNSLCESPSTPLGSRGLWDDCEWCEWWLWRWMTVSGAKPKPQGAGWDLIHHLHISLPSPRDKINPSASVVVPSGVALSYGFCRACVNWGWFYCVNTQLYEDIWRDAS